MIRSNCEARQYSDQMNCARCGLCWDMNDPEPPQCKRETVTIRKTRSLGPPPPGMAHRTLEEIRRMLNDQNE